MLLDLISLPAENVAAIITRSQVHWQNKMMLCVRHCPSSDFELVLWSKEALLVQESILVVLTGGRPCVGYLFDALPCSFQMDGSYVARFENLNQLAAHMEEQETQCELRVCCSFVLAASNWVMLRVSVQDLFAGSGTQGDLLEAHPFMWPAGRLPGIPRHARTLTTRVVDPGGPNPRSTQVAPTPRRGDRSL